MLPENVFSFFFFFYFFKILILPTFSSVPQRKCHEISRTLIKRSRVSRDKKFAEHYIVEGKGFHRVCVFNKVNRVFKDFGTLNFLTSQK